VVPCVQAGCGGPLALPASLVSHTTSLCEALSQVKKKAQRDRRSEDIGPVGTGPWDLPKARRLELREPTQKVD